MRCLLCWRKSVSKEGLCFYHTEAYRNLIKGYMRWCRAYGEVDEVRYLERLLEMPECGEWIKEVAKLKLQRLKEERKVVEENS